MPGSTQMSAEARPNNNEPVFQGNEARNNLQQSAEWKRVEHRLRTEFGDHGFDHWFSRLELNYIEDSVAYCTVPTRFLKSWIASQFYDRLLRCISAEFTSVKHLTLEMRSAIRAPIQSTSHGMAKASPSPSQAARSVSNVPVVIHRSQQIPAEIKALPSTASSSDLSRSPLDSRFVFETFLTGPSNHLAFAAALSAANASPSAPFAYNPLYFHAAVGLGKTHLLQAIANKAQQLGQRAIYLTAEKFMYGFVAAWRSQSSVAFKEKIRSIDILIVDDIQFLRGDSLQQEFGHTINALIDAGKRVVVAADAPPVSLEGLNDRIKSRLSGGLCVEILAFEESLRRNLLEARIAFIQRAQPDFHVPPAVIDYVVSVIKTNGRDLDGALTRLQAHATFAGVRITVESAETAIKDLLGVRDQKRIKIDDILKLVSSHYNISKADLLSARRTAMVVKPRQIAMYLSKVLTLRSLPEIGRRFGGRDHTTVLHAVRKIESLAKTDATLNDELELLKRILME